MRLTLLLCLLASPLMAWTFTSQPMCRLDNAMHPQVSLRFDGATYTITLTREEGWPDGPVFILDFQPLGPVISTSRHQVSGPSLSVTDTGFGNVLDGLDHNTLALASVGGLTMPIDLTNASPAVHAFRACSTGVNT